MWKASNVSRQHAEGAHQACSLLPRCTELHACPVQSLWEHAAGSAGCAARIRRACSAGLSVTESRFGRCELVRSSTVSVCEPSDPIARTTPATNLRTLLKPPKGHPRSTSHTGPTLNPEYCKCASSSREGLPSATGGTVKRCHEEVAEQAWCQERGRPAFAARASRGGEEEEEGGA